MDGKITAIDVNNNGNIVWSSDLDGVPLLSGTLHSYQVYCKFRFYPFLFICLFDNFLMTPHSSVLSVSFNLKKF